MQTTIPIGRNGLSVILDAADAAKISGAGLVVQLTRHNPTRFYIVLRRKGTDRYVAHLSRFVLGMRPNDRRLVRHLNGDKFDNRRCNLSAISHRPLLEIKRDLLERKVMPKTRRNGECLEWAGYVPPHGYGMVSLGKKLNFRIHRIALEVAIGRNLKPNEFACHHCDNPRCLNIDHLFLGDHAANMRDASMKGRLHGNKRKEQV